MKKIFVTILTLCMFAFGLTACGASGTNVQNEEAIDAKAMSIIAKGWEKRSDVVAKNKNKEDSADTLKEAVQAEIDADASLKSAKFDDSKMQEAVLAYINSVEAQMDVLDTTQYQSTEYLIAWSDAYDKRTACLKYLVDTYGLKVSEKYQSDFNELIKNGGVVQQRQDAKDQLQALFDKAEIEAEDNGYGAVTYKTVIENTTDYNYEQVGVYFVFYDEDGVRLGDSYSASSTLKAGEKAKFDAYCPEEGVAEVKIELQDSFQASHK